MVKIITKYHTKGLVVLVGLFAFCVFRSTSEESSVEVDEPDGGLPGVTPLAPKIIE